MARATYGKAFSAYYRATMQCLERQVCNALQRAVIDDNPDDSPNKLTRKNPYHHGLKAAKIPDVKGTINP